MYTLHMDIFIKDLPVYTIKIKLLIRKYIFQLHMFQILFKLH